MVLGITSIFFDPEQFSEAKIFVNSKKFSSLFEAIDKDLKNQIP